MKRLRVLILVAVVSIALAGAFYWSRRSSPSGAATAAECLDAYYESLKSGDVDKYLRCLGEPYRTEEGRRFFEDACREVKDVKNLVQIAGPVEERPSRWVDVEESRAEGKRRRRYHLRQDSGGWVIVAIDPPHESPAPIRYGTPVGDEP